MRRERYRLTTPTLAISKDVFVTIPADQIIEVTDELDRTGFLTADWNGTRILIFTKDIRERGEPASAEAGAMEERPAVEQLGPGKEREEMQFILTGFTQDMGCRVFTFEGIARDQPRTMFTVRADLALLRKYDIRMQELPLLCQSLLERREEGEEGHALTLTEVEMDHHAQVCAATRLAAAQKRKPTRIAAAQN